MKKEFKLVKPLPQSWGVLNDGSQEFNYWVIGYINDKHNLDLQGNSQSFYGNSFKNRLPIISVEKTDFHNILTLEDFKSHFELENTEVIKDLEYYRLNCEDDYTSTPISVLRYIQELERELKNKGGENES